MTSSWAVQTSRSTADWASSGSLISPIPLLVAFQAGSYVALGVVALALLPRETPRVNEELAPAIPA